VPKLRRPPLHRGQGHRRPQPRHWSALAAVDAAVGRVRAAQQELADCVAAARARALLGRPGSRSRGHTPGCSDRFSSASPAPSRKARRTRRVHQPNRRSLHAAQGETRPWTRIRLLSWHPSLNVSLEPTKEQGTSPPIGDATPRTKQPRTVNTAQPSWLEPDDQHCMEPGGPHTLLQMAPSPAKEQVVPPIEATGRICSGSCCRSRPGGSRRPFCCASSATTAARTASMKAARSSSQGAA